MSVQNQVPQTKLFSEIQKVLENPKHKICIAMEIINISLSLILIYHYIYFTYDQLHWHTRAWESCNVTIHLYFLMEFLLRVYVRHPFSSSPPVNVQQAARGRGLDAPHAARHCGTALAEPLFNPRSACRSPRTGSPICRATTLWWR